MSASATIQPFASLRRPHAAGEARTHPVLRIRTARRRARQPHASRAASADRHRDERRRSPCRHRRNELPARAQGRSLPRRACARSLPPPKRRTAPPAASRMPIKRRPPHSGSSRNLPSLHRDEHARALVHAVVIRRRHVEHALAADDLALAARARRAARRETPRCPACRPSARSGIARCRISPASHVLAPNVAGLLPNCFSYAAM